MTNSNPKWLKLTESNLKIQRTRMIVQRWLSHSSITFRFLLIFVFFRLCASRRMLWHVTEPSRI